MLKTLKKFFAFCGADNRRLFMTSIWLGVISAICSAMRIPATAIVIQALLTKNVTMPTLWTSLGIIVISLIITIAINMKATMLQTRAGYRACANKRIEIAEHLRYLPMGWFNDNSLGEVTSVTTNTMENMANIATRVVMVTTRGFLTSGIIAAIMFLLLRLPDWCCSSPSTPPCSGLSRPFPSGSSMPTSGLSPRCWNMCGASPRSRILT